MTSPLRYPGGKTRACKLLWAFLQKEHPDVKEIVSPCLGGASFELFCASRGISVYANDGFGPLANFWNQLKENPIELAQTAELMRPLSRAEFYRMRENIKIEKDDMLRAAYYFAINRSSFSGSTFCGGYSDESAEKRFTETSIERLRMTDMRNIKSVECTDIIDFLQKHPTKVAFIDPPYYIKSYLYGRDGDLHHAFNHEALAAHLLQRKNWILCYNDCEYIRSLYKNCRITNVSWAYGMNATKASSEIVIFPA